MKPEMIEIVLNELLQEHKESSLINAQLVAYLKSLNEKIEQSNLRSDSRGQTDNSETLKLLLSIQNDLMLLKSDVAKKPDIITHKKVFQLFPSFNIREYYQVYGNIAKWLSIFGCTYLLAGLIRGLLTKLGLI